MTPASTLFRFPRLANRSDYPVAPPPFDASKPPKYWRDNTLDGMAPDAIVTYSRLPNPGESLVMRTFQMSVADAIAVNVPGQSVYPPYVPSTSTTATISLPGQAPQLVNPEYLCSAANATRIMREIGGSEIEIENTWGGGAVINYGSGTDRVWTIVRNSARLNAGLLLASQYARGIGAPGHWDLSLVEPAWVSEVQTPGQTTNNLPEVDVPVLPLPTGTKLIRAGMGDLYIDDGADANAPGQLPSNFSARFDAHEALLKDVSSRLTKLGV